MAVIKPSRGIRYNPDRVGPLQSVVSQPYDRISDELQARYYDLSPYNIVRIIHGRAAPGDDPARAEGPNVYTRVLEHFRGWLAEGALRPEDSPALYAYEPSFTVQEIGRATV